MKCTLLTLIFCLTMTLAIRAQYTAKANQFFLEISHGDLLSLSPNQKLSPEVRLCENHRNDFVTTFNMKYFWHKAWGVQTHITINSNIDDSYYNPAMHDDDGIITASRGETSSNLSAGLVYRWDTPRWSIQPYLDAGLSFFTNSNYQSYFKHQGTNDVDLLSLDMGVDRAGFALTPGVQVTWKVKGFFGIFVEVAYMVNLHNSYGNFEKQNVYTLEKEQYRVKEKHGDNLLMRLGCSFKIF